MSGGRFSSGVPLIAVKIFIGMDFISSAASKPTDGGPIHQGIAAKLGIEEIPFTEHTARQITPEDYSENDLIVCMDAGNVEQVEEIVGGDPDKKIYMLLDRDIPWDKKGFAKTYDDILRGCKDLLEKIGG